MSHVTPEQRHAGWLDSQVNAMPKVSDELLRALGTVVYAVQTRDGLVKIGCTSDLARRCKQVGYGHASIIGFMLGDRDDERAIHERLVGLAVRGSEWYPWCDEVLAVVNEMRSALGAPPLAAPRAA